jgi:D-amino-acid dehydrogenase
MKDLIVIGAGVIGVCAAYYSALKGFHVTVLDSASEDHQGCSYGNAGMIVPSHFVPLAAPGAVALGLKWMWNPESPFWIKPRLEKDLIDWAFKFWRASNQQHVQRSAPLLRDLHFASRECFEQLAAKCSNEFQLVQRGLLALCRSQHVLDEEARLSEQAHHIGIPVQVLNASETARLDPGIQMDIAGSIYFPKDCHLSPRLFMQRMKSLAQEAGVRFLWNTAVQEMRRDRKQVHSLRTSSGEQCADQFVLCTGSWSHTLARGLGLKLPMQPGKGYSLTLENPPQLPTICSILTEARVAVTPMGNCLRIGGTMEMAGLNQEVNHRRVAGIINAAKQYFPAFTDAHFTGVKPWSGLRPVSPDGMPYLGRTNRCDNLVIATGHAMMGLSLGPISGKLIAETLSGEPTSINIQALSPDRYA